MPTVYKPRMFWPITISATNNQIYYKYTAGSAGIGTVANGEYLTPELLAAAVQAAIRGGTNPLTTVVVTVSSTGHFVFTESGGFQMTWSITTNSIYAVLGAVASTQVQTGGVVTTVNQHQNGWYAPGAVRFDGATVRDRAMDVVTRNVAGQTKFLTEAELSERIVRFAWLPPEKVYTAHAGSSYINEALEIFWINGRAKFRYWEDAATLLSPLDYVLSSKSINRFEPSRQFTKKALYEIELLFWGYIA